MKKIFCCDKFELTLDNGDVNETYIYGKPVIYDDGDGYTDDCTEHIDIKYCPFCGKEIKFTRDGE